MTAEARETISRAAAYLPSTALRPYLAGAAYEQRGLPAGEHIGLPSCSLTLVLPLETGLLVSPDGQRIYDLAGAMKGNLSKAAGLFNAPASQVARLAAALQEKKAANADNSESAA